MCETFEAFFLLCDICLSGWVAVVFNITVFMYINETQPKHQTVHVHMAERDFLFVVGGCG